MKEMKKSLVFRIVILILFFATGAVKGQTVQIVNDNGKWQLIVKSQPYFIKGVVGQTFLGKVKQYGGNSIRMGSGKEGLDMATKLGLSVLVNLPADAERYGMNYNDTAAIHRQTEKIAGIVRKTRNHPAVLMWAIGNELDYIPGTLPYNLKVWDAVNDAAKAVKSIDPDHPVMTVIGTSMMEKVADIVKRCPDIDLLGINSYGDIYTLPETLKKYGWTKPYIISEWGPDGYWEVKKTSWKAPYEQTGREKYNCYEQKYKAAIDNGGGQCLGSYVFYWSGFKQETTHTWFCMFNIDGMESPLVGLMHRLWTGMKSANGAPIVDSLNIEKFVRYNDIFLSPGSRYSARVAASDPDADSLSFKWEIRPEAVYASYAGQGEKVPQPVPGLIKDGKYTVSFLAPSVKGAYRLFVYAFDGKGHFSTANLPFMVR